MPDRTPVSPAESPINALADPLTHPGDTRFDRWWHERLVAYLTGITDRMVKIDDPHQLSRTEQQALAKRMRNSNMALYRCRHPARVDRAAVQALALQLGLCEPDHNLCAADDGFSELEVKDDASHRRYIPYSNLQLNWHTDGYYHAPERTIRSMLLHCVRPALRGGALEAIDYEIVFGLLHQCDPRYTDALSQPDTLAIPANQAAGAIIRGLCIGPVFFHEGGVLRMRYTARRRNIIWKNDPVVHEAVAALETILASSAELVVRRRLAAGEGMVCNNVLHRRDAFTDSPERHRTRLIYRGRYTQAPTFQSAPS